MQPNKKYRDRLIITALLLLTIAVGYHAFFRNDAGEPQQAEHKAKETAPPRKAINKKPAASSPRIDNTEATTTEEAGNEAERLAHEHDRARMEAMEESQPFTPPLTGVAPPPPAVDVRESEHPDARLEAMGLPPPPQESLPQLKPPSGMDEANPPAWTKAIAEPVPPTAIPDPFTPPPIKVNPERNPGAGQ